MFKKTLKKIKKTLHLFGPGFITGAADDDPSGIATYTQTGAQFGYGQLWTALFMLPFMMATQEASARIGTVTGKGIAAVVKEKYGRHILFFVVALVLVANTINIGADIGAMASSAQLLIPIPFAILMLSFTAIILFLEIYTSYRVYARILKWLALTLLAYPLTVFIVQQPWGDILRATFIPHIEWTFPFFFIITGVLGTTISPYMFFWEASQEVEEEERHHFIFAKARIARMFQFIHSMRFDSNVGMIISEFATWSIIVVAATVLHANGVTDVPTAAQAAAALEPLVHTFPYAGIFAKLIFAIGVIGLGLLAVPVLSGSAAYAVSETFNWREGLNKKLKRAHGFYGVITIATIVGLMINFVGINPIRALVYTAVFNGIAAVPLIYIITRLSSDTKIMGSYASGALSKTLLWITFAGMGAAALALIISLI